MVFKKLNSTFERFKVNQKNDIQQVFEFYLPIYKQSPIFSLLTKNTLANMATFFFLRQPVANSVTVFSNQTKLNKQVFMSMIQYAGVINKTIQYIYQILSINLRFSILENNIAGLWW